MNLAINTSILFSCLLLSHENTELPVHFDKNVVETIKDSEIFLKTPPLPEGSIIQGASGELIKTPEGWDFVLEKETISNKEVSRVCSVFPSRTVEMFEKRIKKDPLIKNFPLRVTGQIFVYRGKNFIDLITIEVAKKLRYVNAPSDAPVDINNDHINGGSRRDIQEKAPSVDQLMKELNRAIPVVGKSSQESIADPKYNAKSSRRRVFFRRAKLMRGKNGLWKFVFNADRWGHSDPPAAILPTTQLMSLQASGLPAQTELLISGKRRRYHQKDYFLLEKWRKPVGTSHIHP